MSSGAIIVVALLIVLAAIGGAWLGSRSNRAAAKAEVEGAEARSDLAHAEHVDQVEQLDEEALLDAITARRKR